MGNVKDVIYKIPLLNSIVQKWAKINRKITKLQTENKELSNKIEKMILELRRNEVFREIDKIHFRKIRRDMEALCGTDKKITEASRWKIENDILRLEQPMVSIIIVNHNGERHLTTLMKSLVEREFYDNFEIIIIDNASEDDSMALIQEYQKKLPIRIIQNDENMSFSAANNIGAKAASGEYLVFLNNDTEVTDGWLDELLISAMTKEKAGVVGAKLIYPEIPMYTVNAGKSYTIQHEGIAFRDGVRENIRYWQPYNVSNGKNIHDCIGKEDCEWACVTAAVMVVKRELFWLCEGFDERYLYGYEDVDFCLKLYEKGFHNYCCGNCIVFHYEFGTQSKDEPSYVRERRVNNMQIFREKWQDFLQKRIEAEKSEHTHIFTE